MEGYRRVNIFMDEEKLAEIERKLEETNYRLDLFIEAFLTDLAGEKKFEYDRYMAGCARTYYKAVTGREW